MKRRLFCPSCGFHTSHVISMSIDEQAMLNWKCKSCGSERQARDLLVDAVDSSSDRPSLPATN